MSLVATCCDFAVIATNVARGDTDEQPSVASLSLSLSRTPALPHDRALGGANRRSRRRWAGSSRLTTLASSCFRSPGVRSGTGPRDRPPLLTEISSPAKAYGENPPVERVDACGDHAAVGPGVASVS